MYTTCPGLNHRAEFRFCHLNECRLCEAYFQEWESCGTKNCCREMRARVGAFGEEEAGPCCGTLYHAFKRRIDYYCPACFALYWASGTEKVWCKPEHEIEDRLSEMEAYGSEADQAAAAKEREEIEWARLEKRTIAKAESTAAREAARIAAQAKADAESEAEMKKRFLYG